MFRIVEDDMPPIPEGCSPYLQEFLTRCFNKDPTKRPSAEQLCEHPWLKKKWGLHKVSPLVDPSPVSLYLTKFFYSRNCAPKIVFHSYVVSALICRNLMWYDTCNKLRCPNRRSLRALCVWTTKSVGHHLADAHPMLLSAPWRTMISLQGIMRS